MPVKKEEITVEDLQKEVAALKKEVASLKRELGKAKSSGEADPRVAKLVEALKISIIEGKSKAERNKNAKKYQELINSL